jgi:penicillin-binding protein 2
VWKRGMYASVNQPGGTSWEHATSSLLTIMGKSGTAEVRTRKSKDDEPQIRGWHPSANHAWFAGWAPMEDPEVAIVVLIEHGGSGGKVAGPVAKVILEGWWTKVRAGSSEPEPEVKP